jgi:hypothetical protein
MAVLSSALVEGSAEDSSRLCQFSKTKLCKFHVLGKCTKGRQCPFAHEGGELRNLPDLRRTKLCKTLIQTGQCLNQNCQYAHSKEELRSTGAFHKTKLCRFMQTGHCTLGAKCNFAHSSVELREPETIESLRPPPGLGFESMVSDLLSEDDDESKAMKKVEDTRAKGIGPAYVHLPALSAADPWSLGVANVESLPSQEYKDGYAAAFQDNVALWDLQSQLAASAVASAAMDYSCFSAEVSNMAYNGAYNWADPWGSTAMSDDYGSALVSSGYEDAGWDWQLFGPSLIIDQTDEMTVKSTKPNKAAPKMKTVRTSESTLCSSSWRSETDIAQS